MTFQNARELATLNRRILKGLAKAYGIRFARRASNIVKARSLWSYIGGGIVIAGVRCMDPQVHRYIGE